LNPRPHEAQLEDQKKPKKSSRMSSRRGKTAKANKWQEKAAKQRKEQEKLKTKGKSQNQLPITLSMQALRH
jgi:hypothetical protein